MGETKTVFGVSMEVFYIIATFGWKLCKSSMRAFQSFKPIYTDQFADDALKAIANAQQLKTTRQAISERRSARIDLEAYSVAVRQAWQNLKNYIQSAFPKDKVANELESAGASFYKKGQINWSAVSGLINAADSYIANNLATLSANDNMPNTFQQAFKDSGTLFVKQLTVFQNADIAKNNAVTDKSKANAAIYESLISMLKTGQLIYRNDERLRVQYTYEFLVAMNKGGSASLRGLVTDQSGMALAGVTVESTEGKYTAITDAKGRYKITRMEAGDYKFVVIKDDYQRLLQDVTVKAGQANTFNVTMTPAMQMVVAA